MPIEISIDNTDKILASKNECTPFDVAALSDGERNALIVATIILTASPETLILIDEPERHLHRSIIVPLIKELTEMRSDCAFVIATHELALASDFKSTHALLVRDCTFENNMAVSWDFDYIPRNHSEAEEQDEINESLKKDLMGSRRRILFVEGEEGSLDRPLYSLIFPGVSVISKSGCREVERAVAGLRGSEPYHWVKAFGVIDEDRREPANISELRQKGVYAIEAYSVESIYYHPELQRRAVNRLCDTTAGNPVQALGDARSAALKAFEEAREHLCGKVAEKTLRADVEKKCQQRKKLKMKTITV
jgi:hypothetical protein